MFTPISQMVLRRCVLPSFVALALLNVSSIARGDTRPPIVIDRVDDARLKLDSCTPAPNDCNLRTALNTVGRATWDGVQYPFDTHLITFDPDVFAIKQTIHFEGFFPAILADLSIIGPTTPGAGVTIQTDTQTPHNRSMSVWDGNVVFANLTIRNNTDDSIGVIGGGHTTFQNCTFQSTGQRAIGVLGAARILNCTFVGFDKYATYAEPSTVIENCTFVGNRCGIMSRDKINLSNSIVVGNRERNLWTASTDGSDVVNVLSNIITGSPVQAGLEVNADGEYILRDNGGPTATIALVEGGYAVGRGKSNVMTDQRGQLRSQDGRNDIGAFEFSRPSIHGS